MKKMKNKNIFGYRKSKPTAPHCTAVYRIGFVEFIPNLFDFFFINGASVIFYFKTHLFVALGKIATDYVSESSFILSHQNIVTHNQTPSDYFSDKSHNIAYGVALTVSSYLQ